MRIDLLHAHSFRSGLQPLMANYYVHVQLFYIGQPRTAEIIGNSKETLGL